MADVYAVVSETGKLSTPTRTIHLSDPLSYEENLAHFFGKTLLNDDGTAANLSGYQVTAKFKRPDDQTVELSGTISGNVAYVILAESCYLAEGRFTLEMYLVKTGVENATKRCIMRVKGMTEKNTSSTIIDPGEVVPDIDDVIAQMTAMQEATAAAEAAAEKSVRYDTTQSLTDAQKTTARQNIGAAQISPTDSGGSGTGMLIIY